MIIAPSFYKTINYTYNGESLLVKDITIVQFLKNDSEIFNFEETFNFGEEAFNFGDKAFKQSKLNSI